jgi:hypothetical protein
VDVYSFLFCGFEHESKALEFLGLGYLVTFSKNLEVTSPLAIRSLK